MLEKFKLKLKFSKDWNFREKISDERVNSPQSARQKSPTALKRLDISIKRTLKIGHRLFRFCAIQQIKKLWQYLCHSFLVGAGGFASRGLKNSPQDCFLPSADGRPVRILPAPAQKRTRNLSCGFFLVGAGGFEPPKH